MSFSCVGAGLFGEVDLGFACCFALPAMMGVLLGGWVGKKVDDKPLRHFVGYLLVVLGITVVIRTIMTLVNAA